MKRNRPDDIPRCSFCHKSQDVVGKLISSPSDYAQVFICDECIIVCNTIIEDDKPAADKPAADKPLADKPAPTAADGPQRPFEIKDLLDRYLKGVVTQEVHVHYSPGFRRRHDPGAIILAIRKPDGQIIFNPPADMELTEEDYAIAMGAIPALLALDVVKPPET